uniref:Uncharacterized protein n=1 Tax=Oryza nivara TaxID=4536 RepID=A0A0E0FI63_ORYNI
MGIGDRSIISHPRQKFSWPENSITSCVVCTQQGGYPDLRGSGDGAAVAAMRARPSRAVAGDWATWWGGAAVAWWSSAGTPSDLWPPMAVTTRSSRSIIPSPIAFHCSGRPGLMASHPWPLPHHRHHYDGGRDSSNKRRRWHRRHKQVSSTGYDGNKHPPCADAPLPPIGPSTLLPSNSLWWSQHHWESGMASGPSVEAADEMTALGSTGLRLQVFIVGCRAPARPLPISAAWMLCVVGVFL